MADNEKEVLSKQEKKEAKRAEKARKLEESRRKKLEKAGYSPEEVEAALSQAGDYEEEGGSKLAVFFVTIMIVGIWIVILSLLIKMDVGGFGSTVMTPVFKNIPYINKILPKMDNEIMMESTESSEYPYVTLDDAIARIKELEVELQEERNKNEKTANENENLLEQSKQLEQYKAEEAQFEERKQKFEEQVVFSDQAPDINEYRKYYEEIEPANAEAIYKQVVEQIANTEEVDKYVSMYSNMKPKQAAAIFDTMTNDFALVAQILKGMEPDTSAKILGAMDAKNAAKLTELMNPNKKSTTK